MQSRKALRTILCGVRLSISGAFSTSRGLPDQPEFSWWITRTRSSAAASPSRRAGVPSVEPSSTKITSYASRGSDWRSRDATHSSM